jgi:hypothetical protein
MDRPKHRWFIVLGALVAFGALLLARQWQVSTPAEPVSVATTTPVERRGESKPVEAAAQSHAATASTSATGGGLRGRILDAVTRRAITEFEIRLTRVQRGQIRTQEDPIIRSFQSENGRFLWDDVAPDTWEVVVSTHGYQQFNAGAQTIVAGKTTREIVMPLLRGYIVSGRVVERSTGAGIAQAWISFRSASEWRGTYLGGPYEKSKEDGSFVIDGVPGGDVVLTVGADDHAYRRMEILVDEKTPPQEIALSAGGTIAGMVTTASGAPVKGDIMLGGPDIGYGGKIDDTGRFSFKLMPAAKYSLSATTPAGSARQEIVLGPDERKEDIVLVVGGGRSVRGTVRGLRSEQLQRSFISLRPQSGAAYFSSQLDAQGAYVLNGVPPGAAELSLWGADREFGKTVNVPAEKDIVVDFAVAPGSRLSGRVTQAGQPVANRMVWIGPADASTRVLYRPRTSDDGRYEVEGLPPGDYRVRADQDVSRSVAIAGDTVLNIDIPLVQLGGRVLEDGGAIPIVEADVYIRGSEAATARVHGWKRTDHFGQFSLTGIEPGEIMLTVYKPGYELHREKLAYAAPITNRTIALRRDTGVEVRVHRSASDGERLRGFMLSEKIAGIDRAIDLWIPIDREGVGSLPRALEGSTLEIYGPSEKPIVIAEWDGSSLELTL